MSKEYRALTGISYRDAKGAEVSVERGDPVPAAVLDEHSWLLEDAPGRGPAAEELGDRSPDPGAAFDHDFTVPGPAAETKEE